MARNRMIKAAFWDDEKLGRISRDARLLYIGTWNQSDDCGVVKGNPIWLRNQIFPYDEDVTKEMMTGWLTELVGLKMMFPFQAHGEMYYWIRNFKKHQSINRPSGPQNPEPPAELIAQYGDSEVSAQGEEEEGSASCRDNSVDTHGALTEDSLNAHGAMPEHSTYKREREREREGKEKEKDAEPNASASVPFERTEASEKFIQILRRFPWTIREFDDERWFVAEIERAQEYQGLSMIEELNGWADWIERELRLKTSGQRSKFPMNFKQSLRNRLRLSVKFKGERDGKRAGQSFAGKDYSIPEGFRNGVGALS